ncbi:acetyl-CoA carboxylase carboxyltransferase subunit beta [Fructilactobacillus sanfranciscensis]|jgi:acetyl-CoA carboxylase carboxyl transferase subunit beta|uniref:Acetyl-coenzyme A carboxylase carboxyl transferase subunit beta n=1 Tax=Fructilactobacillus sanfranciscensis TaxID=1625 RepID=A0A5C4THU0_FRUSA|nr:acetyl-CoA carboxylase carboxyltransferase subunit beta [Fructilactobacillus sanfranciscensis]NDR60748.1 acetyl-CoA carboxylase carboxyl transferase subunit beta [Fructilactobacillus sanfranciscensis]NDR70149.1 acetyl-CoA carboxylase carboxyl transferase subunit beta [Fructilactobacillus sanfranciscensis]NDS16410.1 acetyl-CoA carboxylase carboxyl transferase subunit beta [Fructilactobacillus sanfranciscensis]POH19938.1 acetyl-CoA carboxylase subunit beta [Fructilactobacillus sanfranciscensis
MINNDGKPSPQELQKRMDDIPDVWLKCPICGHAIYKKHINEYRTCPECHYGFRLGAKARIEMLCDDFKPLNLEVKAADKFDDPKYLEKLNKARQVTGLNEGVLSGIGSINGHKAAIGVMDWRFIMGSLGTATGEIIARLFEKATELNLPVILFTASGGARMQEGIESLMQMAKVSETVAKHSQAGLLYISYLCDPTTGGVTASFAMQGDLIFSEPHSLIGFAGRRVIEQTIQQNPPKDFQRAETLLKHGFLDAIIKREDMKATLSKVLSLHEGGDQND